MPTHELEYRFAEIRASGREVTGTVVRYGDVADIAGVFTEQVSAGAFTLSDDLVLNMQHDRSLPVARMNSNLDFHDSPTELRFTARIPPTSHGNTALELIEHGLLRGVSVEMRVRRDRWEGGGARRIVSQADLHGLALVDSPAYPSSSLAMREHVFPVSGPYTPWWMVY